MNISESQLGALAVKCILFKTMFVFKCFNVSGLSYTVFGLICTKNVEHLFNEIRLQCEIARLDNSKC